MTAPTEEPFDVIARVLWWQMECQNDGCGNCVAHGHWLEDDGTCGTSNGAAYEIVNALDLDNRETDERHVCDRCGQQRGLFHKGCDGEWVRETRTRSVWKRADQ